MSTAQYKVTGMTCDHCVSAVREEVGKLDGVSDVAVDLESGRLTIASAAPLSESEVVSAVDEAGYVATVA